ncbi:putative toxin-antitoxin system toxin component, PIN family [uncultured Imperialibacter sp.]|uniref:putative toxin-antitoxin system toxin component, PIN family n=1 Tax=uncultured Imperialibacter sp. TaxID=1672639 RepID=UPI0030D9C12B
MLKIVLDTNILLVAVSDRSPYHWVYEAFLKEKFQLLVTTEILSEYQEIITEHMGSSVADNVLLSIENSVNTSFITRYFKWNLINADPDDNKFSDCAVAGSSDYLVTEDKHFEVLKSIGFPIVNVIGIGDFKQLLTSVN